MRSDGKSRIYLDHNASAPLKPGVRRAMAEALELCGNPSSVHGFGRVARRAIEQARESVAALVGAAPASVVFTSGGTEANALAIRGSGRRRVLVSAVEHDSVLQAVPDAERIPVDASGIVRLERLESMLSTSEEPAIVALMLANNETGVIQPVREAAEIAHAHGALLHCDVVQAVGRVAVDKAALNADYLTLSAHKIGGPAGAGALVVAGSAPLTAQTRGGGQERGRRGGTEKLLGIIGFGAAATAAAEELELQPRIAALRDRTEGAIAEASAEAVIHGGAAARVAGTSCISMPGVPAETQLMNFDLAGIAVSAGAACSSGQVATSHVLEAMGVDPALAASAIRVSLGWNSTEGDVDAFVQAWTAIHRRVRRRAAS